MTPATDRFTHAIVRRPGPDLVDGITSGTREQVDPARALNQHDAYVAALRRLGLAVTILPPLPGHPDACFVEDTAVVVAGGAVVTRPGAEARRGETSTVAQALAHHHEPEFMTSPATLDGGDVLIVGDRGWIGLSQRTNTAGADMLTSALALLGITMTAVTVDAGLHLKSSVNWVGEGTLLITEDFADNPAFAGLKCLVVPTTEAYACNTLLINGTLLTPVGFPDTRDLLRKLDCPVMELETDEFRRVDGVLTCLSLRW